MSIVKLRILRKNPRTAIAPADTLKLGDIQDSSPVLPTWVTTWNESDQAMHSEIMDEDKKTSREADKF